MNARIIKETRSVLPVLGVTMLASVAPKLIWEREVAGGAGLAFFTLCCVLMGAACFGSEYQWRTMPLLLAQPVPRRRIWNEKMLVLAGALALGLGFFLICVPLDKASYLFLALLPFCVFCTAPYMALRVQSTFLAAVLTFGLPFGLCGLLALMWSIFAWIFPDAGHWIHEICMVAFQDLRRFSPDTARWFAAWADNDPPYLVCIPAAIYCAVCYRLGYRAFLKLEAADMQSKELKLPMRLELALAGPFNLLVPRYRDPWTSLLRKEFRIQKDSFVVAAVMCFCSVLIALVWDLDRNPDHHDFLAGMTFVPIAVLVFIIPSIAPGGSVAEERKWGVSTWQRALPVSSRKQWVVKVVVVIFTCGLLGVVLPTCLWMADGWVFRLPIGPGPFHWDRLFHGATAADFYLGVVVLLDWVLGYLLWLSLGVFASSLCANSAKAVVLSIGLITGSAGLAVGSISWVIRLLGIVQPEEPSMELVVMLLAVYFAGLILLTQYLAYRNHRTGEPETRGVWMQVGMVTAVIVLGAALGFVFWSLHAGGAPATVENSPASR